MRCADYSNLLQFILDFWLGGHKTAKSLISCRSTEQLRPENYEEVLGWGYSPCGNCKP